MTILLNDFETYSAADLKKTGHYRYAADPSTRALMLAYHITEDLEEFDERDVKQWVPNEGPMPLDLHDALMDPNVEKRAFNAAFELAIWQETMGIETPVDQWKCTMVQGYGLSFPGMLAKVGPIVDLPSDAQKDKEGKRLINIFSKPKKKTKKEPWTRHSKHTRPEEWDDFLFYNRQDVVAEGSILRRIWPWDLPDHEWDLWRLDHLINRRGVPINMDHVDAAIEYLEYVRTKKIAEMKEITGIDNPRSTQQLLPWLKEHGYRFDDMKRGHVETAFTEDDLEDDIMRVLELRLEVSKTSPDKFYAFKRAAVETDEGWVVRGTFQFAGAQRTWRWSGRLFQPHNLPRPSRQFEEIQEKIPTFMTKLSPEAKERIIGDPMDFLATSLRSTVTAPPGQVCVIADLNAIENRVLGWMAGDEKILDVFRNDRCPYVDFATYMFNAPYDDLWHEFKVEKNKEKRTTAKPAVLGCGYMLSAGEERENRRTGEMEATGLLGYAKAMGVPLTIEQAKESVSVWRATYQDVVDFWWDIESAAKDCVRYGKETDCGFIGFDMSGPFLRMILPSNRCLHYCRPQLDRNDLYFCEKKRRYLPEHLCEKPNYARTKTKENLTYEGLNDIGKWGRIFTHPGKLTENADQAISRDLLAHGMKNAEAEGLPIRLHVHDELLALTPERRAEESLKLLIECMSDQPKWAPGLPLRAEGVVSKIWLKD